MTSTQPTVRVPFSRRVIANALGALVTLAAAQLGITHFDPSLQVLVTGGVATVAGWAVREERNYLSKALAALNQLGK